MEPITLAIATAVATGLAKDAVKTGYAKLKSLIFSASPEKRTELDQAIRTLEKAKMDLEHLIATTAAAQNTEILKQATLLMQEAGDYLSVTRNNNNTATNNSKAASFGNVSGNVSL